MKNTDKIGFTMPHMEESDGISRKSKKQRKAERKLKRDMRKAGKKGRESEFMWDPHNEVMRIIPTDDGDSHNYPHLDKMYDILHPPPKKEAPINRHHGTHSIGDRLSDKNVYDYEAKFHGLASAGRGLTAEDVSDIQEDEHGQYVTWEKEITRGKDRGEKVIDTIRPVKKTAGGLFNPKYPDGYHTFKKN
jgi:hypothetical protein